MKSFLLSFRLHDPDPIRVKTISGKIITRLTRQEKYDRLVDYLLSISLEESVIEDDTTSLILFKTSNKFLDTIPNEIISICELLNEDELFFIEFDGVNVRQDCRVYDKKVNDTFAFKNWIS